MDEQPTEMRDSGRRGSLAAIAAGLTYLFAILVIFVTPLAVRAEADRTISFTNMHTKETLTVLYKKDGRYVPEAMTRINHMMRDWRRNEQTRMDPELIDLIYEIHQDLGSKDSVHVVSGYRSAVTNAAMRRRGGGQAKFSQHIHGKAVDLYFPDVPISKIRDIALKYQRGGVGFYPNSNQPFVHVDTGRVRHWPRMSRQQLARLFPDGNTLHIPRDGKPLPRKVKTIEIAGTEVTVPDRPDRRPAAARRIEVASAAQPAAFAPEAGRDLISSTGSGFSFSLLGNREPPAAAREQEPPAGRQTVASLTEPRLVLPAQAPAARPVPAPTLRPVYEPGNRITVAAAPPPIPTLRPHRPASDIIASLITASIPERPVSAPLPINPMVRTQRADSLAFATLAAPDQQDLRSLIQAPATGIRNSFSPTRAYAPSSDAFTGPAVQALGLAPSGPAR